MRFDSTFVGIEAWSHGTRAEGNEKVAPLAARRVRCQALANRNGTVILRPTQSTTGRSSMENQKRVGRSSFSSTGRKPTIRKPDCVVAIFAPRLTNTRRTAQLQVTLPAIRRKVALGETNR